MMVSVIIRTYNEEKLIGQCLASVFTQEIDDDIEVIVVDSGSTDKTVEIVGSFKDVIVTQIPQKDFTFGYSLNIGIERCKGEFIVLLSAHAIPSDNKWLHHLIKNFKVLDVVGVYGKQLPNRDCNPLDKRDLNNLYGAIWKEQRTSCIFSSANAAIRREMWKKVAFDENLSGSEDRYWASRVQEKGHRIVYEPLAAVYHSHNENLKQIFKRSYREMLGQKERFGLRPIILLLIGTPLLIFQDVIYILSNRYNIRWVAFSPVIRIVRCIGAISAIIFYL